MMGINMKRLLPLLLFLLLCCAVQVDARMNAYIAGSVASGGCTYTAKDSHAPASIHEQKLSYNYNATSFTTGSAYTLKRLTVYLKCVGTCPAVNITGYIYSDNSGAPNTALATSTDTIAASTIGTSDYAYYPLNFTGVELSNATKYHIVLTKAYTDSENYIYWYIDQTESGQSVYYGNTSPPSSLLDSSGQGVFATYSCE